MICMQTGGMSRKERHPSPVTCVLQVGTGPDSQSSDVTRHYVGLAVPWAVASLYDGGGSCDIARLTSGGATPPSNGGGTVADEPGTAGLT